MITLTFIFSVVIYSILSLLFLICYRVCKILNLSLGSLYTLGAYSYTINPLAPVFLGIALGSFLHFATRSLNLSKATVFSLGLAILIEEIVRINVRVQYVISDATKIEIFGFTTFLEHFISFLLSILILTIFLILFLTRVSMKIKVVEEDWELAEVYGIDTKFIRFLLILISSSLFCIIGGLYTSGSVLYPTMGWKILIFSIIIATVANFFKENAYLAIPFMSLLVCTLELFC